jgi:alkylation response protein AidB-like acyl-CoA dehydrogenase
MINPTHQPREDHMLEQANELRARIELLGPMIVDRAEEIELARKIPDDLVQALKSIGVFRMCTARSHGGLELPLPKVLEIIQDFARIDGSVGWTAMIACGGSLFMSLLPRETYDRVYDEGPDVAVAGSVQPVGKAERTKDGWHISGRWPFASGCSHADWMAGFCAMMNDGSS